MIFLNAQTEKIAGLYKYYFVCVNNDASDKFEIHNFRGVCNVCTIVVFISISMDRKKEARLPRQCQRKFY